MKFTCDSCNAQYMISDDKVGPAGVKVRCKKCGHVIFVRRVSEAEAGDTKPSVAAPAGAGPSPGANGATHPGVDAPAQRDEATGAEGAPAAGGGLDAELGSAFDHAFGDTPPSTPAPGADADLGATQAMGAEDAAKVFAAAAAPTATEWYVAIGQAQVGPLPLGEVKKKWEAGDVGPDSLVWRPGMADWAPLTTVSELAGFLAPVPRAAAAAARPSSRPAMEAARSEPQPEPQAEVAWKPVGASALAALASEEIASRAPDAKPAPVRPAGVKSLVDALPDGGGVDPTGALPLNIKALETTGEKKIERRSSVARGAEKVRHRRSATRALVLGLAAGVLLVGGAVAAAVYLGVIDTSRITGKPAPAAPRTAEVPLPPPPAMPAAAPQQTPQPAAAPPPQAAVAAAPPAAAAPRAPEPRPEPKAEPRPEHRAPARTAKVEPPPKREPPQQRVAQAPPPAPEPKPTKKGDSILDFDSGGNDSALDDALGGGSAGSTKRSVYVPPARAGGGDLPDKVSQGDINAAVAGRIDALRKCLSEQKAREPDLTGTLKMRWIILGDGSVRDVKCLTPEFAKGQFAACLGGIVRNIRFPRSATTGQEVTFPFNF